MKLLGHNLCVLCLFVWDALHAFFLLKLLNVFSLIYGVMYFFRGIFIRNGWNLDIFCLNLLVFMLCECIAQIAQILVAAYKDVIDLQIAIE